CAAAADATGDHAFLDHAKRLLALAERKFWDDSGSGFFDDEPRKPAEESGTPLPVERKKSLGDTPAPGGNSRAALACPRIGDAGGDERLRGLGERALQAFAGSAPMYRFSAGTYGLALAFFLAAPPHVVIVGDPKSNETMALHAAALKTYRPGKS